MTTTLGLNSSLTKQLPASRRTAPVKKWTSPRVFEIAVGLEINSYARAELN